MGQIDKPTPTSATRPAAARPEHAGQATTATASGRYSLDFSGRRLEVEASRDGLNTKAQLYVDGELVDESETSFEANRLHGDSVEVTVQWRLFGGVKSCLATPLDADGKKKANADIPFTPPAGTFAAKLDDFGNRHPTLYASRHVLIATGEVLIGLLGISAILFGLLPRLDLPPLPSIPLPDLDVTLPDWDRDDGVGIPDAIISVPVGWVRSLWERFDLSIPLSDWIRTIVGSAKW
jgi:hypothetical protein